jgi:hypothetical protein
MPTNSAESAAAIAGAMTRSAMSEAPTIPHRTGRTGGLAEMSVTTPR